MRVLITKGHSTKAERRFAEILKELHIPFEYKVKINGHEVDFLIGKDIYELDGHVQKVDRNKMFLELGYTPFHLNNWEITPLIKKWLSKKYGGNKFISTGSHSN